LLLGKLFSIHRDISRVKYQLKDLRAIYFILWYFFDYA
jgi:hypothetical protein